MKAGVLYPLLKNAKRVCFVGDSITEGTKNGGIPWYEPIENLISGTIMNVSIGGCTTKMLLENKMLQKTVSSNADLFVVAIGTNDIRYRDAKICAMTSDEYTQELQKLKQAILLKNPAAKMVFIAPWISTDGDSNSKLLFADKIAMYEDYSAALKKWCSDSQDTFVDANAYISDKLDHYPQKRYLVDYIHPNGREGVQLYSEAVLLAK